MQELRDRVAVVTGGGSGIGEALARACAVSGMRVVVADIERAAAEACAKSIVEGGGEAHAQHCDVTRREALDELADAAWSRFGGCHLLCNNAGVLVQGPLPEMTDTDWSWVLDVNLRGVIHGVGAFVPRMIEQGGPAHIVNTASVAGLCALPTLGVYSTSKFAVVALSESLRADLAPHGIGVSVLCPGGVTTRIFDSERNRPDARRTQRQDYSDEEVEEAQSREDMLSPERVAEVVLDAVRADELYAITHPSWKPMIEQRYAGLLEAFDRAARRDG